MVETFIFTVVVAGLVFNVMNFFMIRNKLIDYELEKAKKLDDAIHKIEDDNEKN